MKTIVFCSFKGGTGKTSTVLHLGAALAKFHSKKILLIDFDSQANLSTGIGFGTDHINTVVPVLQGEKKIEEVIQNTTIPNLSIVLANTYLDQIESTSPLVTDLYAHERLRKSLKGLEYDYCLIDIPPSLGWLCQSAFFASQYSIICATPEPYSVLALDRLSMYHKKISENHSIETLGVLFSMWDERGATNQAFCDGVETVFPTKIFDTKIRRDVSVSRAILQGLPVFEAFKNSRVSKDYIKLTEEFLARNCIKKSNEELVLR
ncbi:Sporulation initiation inhibitor protein soj [Candidatus Rubidus massiliensis]|nr:Sporulation initiation inhibitor protein soj [Candidatus Rubidus massiliensis]